MAWHQKLFASLPRPSPNHFSSCSVSYAVHFDWEEGARWCFKQIRFALVANIPSSMLDAMIFGAPGLRVEKRRKGGWRQREHEKTYKALFYCHSLKIDIFLRVLEEREGETLYNPLVYSWILNTSPPPFKGD